MKLYLTVSDGPAKGLKVLLKPGLKIGRSGGGLVLKDPRASGFHAQIEIDSDGSWVVVDQGSTNGIKHKGQRIERLRLTDGVRFRIGGSTLSVEAEPSPVKSAPREIERSEYPAWKKTLIDYLSQSPLRQHEPSGPLDAFQPALVLEFIEGSQYGTVWTLGYGPRRIGRISPDLPIFEDDIPDTTFEVIPTRQGIQYKTEFPHKVFLNEQSMTSEVLKEGDIIRVSNTKLKVRFV